MSQFARLIQVSSFTSHIDTVALLHNSQPYNPTTPQPHLPQQATMPYLFRHSNLNSTSTSTSPSTNPSSTSNTRTETKVKGAKICPRCAARYENERWTDWAAGLRRRILEAERKGGM